MPRLSSARLGSVLARLGSMRLSSVVELGGRTIDLTVTSSTNLHVRSRKLDIALHAPQSNLILKSRS